MKKSVKYVVLLLAGLLIGGFIAFLLLNPPKGKAEEVTIRGIEYTTNLKMDEFGGDVYVYLPVNAEVGEAVVERKDGKGNEEIRSFLDSLDTLVPGEHMLELGDYNLHVIIDGMEE